MKESKKMPALLSAATVALVLGMFALAGCNSTSGDMTSKDTSSSTPAASSSSDSSSPTTSTPAQYTKEDVEKACAGSCHGISAVDAWKAADVDASTAKSMVPSLSDDQAAAIAAFYASK